MSQGEPAIDAARAAQTLGVDPACGAEALRVAFRVAVKRAHPDRPGGDADRLRAVIGAYEYLRAYPALEPVTTIRRAPPPILEITPLEALTGVRRPVAASDGGVRCARLPAGLRAGDRVRLAGDVLVVTITSQGGLAVIGDHLCVSLEVESGVLRQGGSVRVDTPMGARHLRITRQDAIRGLARLTGEGLPARAGRPRGDLLVWLRPALARERVETTARAKLRRFTADWAA
ncbi:MAG TPA: molecular chaperone DnaJ [Caulobacteraceae bacterium]|jgi:curved DNA-binding protein